MKQGSPAGTVLFIAAAIPSAVQYTYQVSVDNLSWTVGVQAAKTEGRRLWLTEAEEAHAQAEAAHEEIARLRAELEALRRG